MKYIKMFFSLEFLACGFFGITQYISTTKIANLFASIFCFICAFLLFHSAHKKKSISSLTNQVNPAPEPPKGIGSSPETKFAEIEQQNQLRRRNSRTMTI